MSDLDTTPSLPIDTIVELGDMQHMSTRIRWYAALGYTPSEIYKHLDIRPQQVHNVLKTLPKRAAREDLPELKLVLKDTNEDA